MQGVASGPADAHCEQAGWRRAERDGAKPARIPRKLEELVAGDEMAPKARTWQVPHDSNLNQAPLTAKWLLCISVPSRLSTAAKTRAPFIQ